MLMRQNVNNDVSNLSRSYLLCVFAIQQHKDKNICRLSIELLDTEDSHSEDPVEVEV